MINSMKVIRSAAGYEQWYRGHVAVSSCVGLVATKGCIHEGHLTLVRMARAECQHVIVSIAIHPAQFSDCDDFDKFPRQAAQDLEALQETGAVDVLLLLKTDDCSRYGGEHGAFVRLVSDILPSLPEYFDAKAAEGEATMLVKVINLTRPTRVYLGRKDILKAVMLQRILDDLLYPVTVVEIPTVRAESGVAFDCRLQALSELQVRTVAVVYRSLKVMVATYLQDVLQSSTLIERGRATLETEVDTIKVLLIRVAHPYGFQDIERIDPAIGAVAIVKVSVAGGKAILLDNVILAPRIPAHEKTLWGLVRSNRRPLKD